MLYDDLCSINGVDNVKSICDAIEKSILSGEVIDYSEVALNLSEAISIEYSTGSRLINRNLLDKLWNDTKPKVDVLFDKAIEREKFILSNKNNNTTDTMCESEITSGSRKKLRLF